MASVLIVDDDPRARALLRAMLEPAGHDVREAAGGDEALAAIKAWGSDLVLCDALLPGRGGLRTIRAIGHWDPRLPVVAMSGGGAADRISVLTEAAHLGSVGALAKPLDRRAVLAVVARSLAGR